MQKLNNSPPKINSLKTCFNTFTTCLHSSRMIHESCTLSCITKTLHLIYLFTILLLIIRLNTFLLFGEIKIHYYSKF